jgi:DNA-binding XRE family transcriptional regulator
MPYGLGHPEATLAQCWRVPRSDPTNDEWQDFAAALGRNLQRLRLERGLSQDQVAYRAQLSRFTYQKYESGQSRPGLPANPTVRSLLAIAQVLEIPLDAMLPPNAPDLRAK